MQQEPSLRVELHTHLGDETSLRASSSSAEIGMAG